MFLPIFPFGHVDEAAPGSIVRNCVPLLKNLKDLEPSIGILATSALNLNIAPLSVKDSIVTLPPLILIVEDPGEFKVAEAPGI